MPPGSYVVLAVSDSGADNPAVALGAVKVQPPAQQTTFDIGPVKFDSLSDEGLDLVEKVPKGWIEVQQPLPTDNNRWRPR